MNEIERPMDDNYPTQPGPVLALLSVEAFPGGIWEPCAGSGQMAAVLRQEGHTVRATTWLEGRHEKAFPKHRVDGGIDFLTTTETKHPNIVSNFPYGKLHGKNDRKTAEKLIRHAISLRPAKIALLLGMQFLGGEDRQSGLFAEFPPARFYQFSDRLLFYPEGTDTAGLAKMTTYHGWFIWEYPYRVAIPQFGGWLNSKDFEQC